MKVNEILNEVDPGFEKFMKGALPTEKKGFQKGVTIAQAFGSKEYNMLHDLGIRFYEKPSYWDDLDRVAQSYKPLTSAQVEKAEKAIGVPFKIYTQDKVFGSGQGKSKDKDSKDGFWPMSDANMQKEPIYIVHMKDGSKYLVDGTMANSYIRMWAKIED